MTLIGLHKLYHLVPINPVFYGLQFGIKYLVKSFDLKIKPGGRKGLEPRFSFFFGEVFHCHLLYGFSSEFPWERFHMSKITEVIQKQKRLFHTVSMTLFPTVDSTSFSFKFKPSSSVGDQW